MYSKPVEATDEASDSVLKLLDFPSPVEFATQICAKARLVDTTLFRAHMLLYLPVSSSLSMTTSGSQKLAMRKRDPASDGVAKGK
jgi:hypothetical protein